ncbi:MAG: hypothetical protein U9R72_04145 [Chloroflexota bacterium]|nr:hypothetical protein [Chloroflexota bacterium]
MPPASAADEGHRTDEAPPAIWQFVAVVEYVPPPPDVMETTRRRISTLWRRLKPDIEEPVPHVKPEDELTTLPEWHLRRAAPPPEWGEAAEALDTTLKDWLTNPSRDEPVRLLVTPPHIGRSAILQAWAEQREWRLLSPPSPEQILAREEAWFWEQFSADGPWVLADLERLYLRHASGLDLICGFLDRAHAGDLGLGLIACDSWAWAFLDHVWRSWLPPTLTLQAYDEHGLAVCFRHLARTMGGRQVRFRQSDDGSDVLPPPDAATTENHQSDFLHHLATYSRGNLGVAWAIWRSALSSEPVADVPDEEEADHQMVGRTIWVTPWSRVEHPTLPSGAGWETAVVLHALLLHRGLVTEMLPRLLPMTTTRIREILNALRVAGLVSRDGELWQVTATGYPAVREFLQRNGYLTDAF